MHADPADLVDAVALSFERLGRIRQPLRLDMQLVHAVERVERGVVRRHLRAAHHAHFRRQPIERLAGRLLAVGHQAQREAFEQQARDRIIGDRLAQRVDAVVLELLHDRQEIAPQLLVAAFVEVGRERVGMRERVLVLVRRRMPRRGSALRRRDEHFFPRSVAGLRRDRGLVARDGELECAGGLEHDRARVPVALVRRRVEDVHQLVGRHRAQRELIDHVADEHALGPLVRIERLHRRVEDPRGARKHVQLDRAAVDVRREIPDVAAGAEPQRVAAATDQLLTRRRELLGPGVDQLDGVAAATGLARLRDAETELPES